MPVFELQTPKGETYEIEAPTMESAAKSFQDAFGNVTQADLFTPERQARARVMNERPDLYGRGERTFLQGVDDRVRSVAGGVPLIGGWMDEVSAGLNTGFGTLGNYEQELAYQRERDRAQLEQRPGETITGNVAGAIVGTLAGAKGLSRAGVRTPLPRLMPKRMVAGGVVGGTAGYEEGFSRGENLEDRLERGQDSAKWGSVFGTAAPIVAKPLGWVGNRIFGEADQIAPTLDAIKATSQAKYRAADAAGVALKPETYRRILDDVFTKAADEGEYFAANHPMLKNSFDELEHWRGSAPTLQNIKQLRTKLQSAYDPTNPGQSNAMQVALNRFDDLVEGLTARDVVMGDPRRGVTALKEARQAWSRFRKAEVFENIFQNALNKQGANYNRADFIASIRQQLAAIAKDGFKRHRYFNPEERTAILRVVRGGRVENFMRWLGKYSAKSPVGVVASAATAGGAGMLIGGPPGAAIGTALGVGLTTAGTAARPIATRMGARAFRRADELTRFGGPRPRNALLQAAQDATALGLISQSGRAGDYASQRIR
jgi:hypothetical protein